MSQSIRNGSCLAVFLGLDTNNFFLAESTEGNSNANNFLDDDDDNNNKDVNVNVVKVSNDGEQSPNNGFIDLALAELIVRFANYFRRKRDGLVDGSNKDIFVFGAGNIEHHASAHLRTKHHRQVPAWFKL